MKVLVVYYSLEGSTKLIAESIAKTVNADILPLVPKKDISGQGFGKYIWGGRQVIMKEKPELLPLEKDPSIYDLIFIGTPVWAGNYAPALRSFFNQYKLSSKKIALFCTHEGGQGKVFDQMKLELRGNFLVSEKDFPNVKKSPQKAEESAVAWARDIVNVQ